MIFELHLLEESQISRFTFIPAYSEMKDKNKRLSTLRDLMNGHEKYESLQQTHTRLCEGIITFRPADILRFEPAIVFSQSCAIIYSVQDRPSVRLHIDCSDMNRETAHKLWKYASMKDMTTGFKIFNSIPCSVTHVRIFNPQELFSEWAIVKRFAPALMSRKMRMRTEWS